MEEETSAVEKRISKDKELLLEHLRNNAIVEIACQRAEVSRATYYRYRKQDPVFAEKADEAQQEGTLLMNDMAEGYLLSAIKNKSMAGISLWLKAHHPAYSTKLDVNANVRQTREVLTPEEQEVVEEALQLSSIVKKEGINKLNS